MKNYTISNGALTAHAVYIKDPDTTEFTASREFPQAENMLKRIKDTDITILCNDKNLVRLIEAMKDYLIGNIGVGESGPERVADPGRHRNIITGINDTDVLLNFLQGTAEKGTLDEHFKKYCELNSIKIDKRDLAPEQILLLRKLLNYNKAQYASADHDKNALKIITLELVLNDAQKNANNNLHNQEAQKNANNNLYNQENGLNKENFRLIMSGVKEALNSDQISTTARPEDAKILKKMANLVELLGAKAHEGRLENKLSAMRYNLDNDGLYEELRNASLALVDASKICVSPAARERLQLMAAVMELLAQQHNTALISACYDDASRKLERAHGKNFEGPSIPNQAISSVYDASLSIGGGVGSAGAGLGVAANFLGKFGATRSSTLTIDFDRSPSNVHMRGYNVGLEAKAGADVANMHLAKLGGNLTLSHSSTLFTQHDSSNDQLKGLITDIRESYIGKSPLMHFKPTGYNVKKLAEAEIECINRTTTIGPLNALRNIGEDFSGWWQSSRGGIDHGKRPFNELTFLKAQGGASKDLMANLFKSENDPALNQLATLLLGQPKLPLTAPSYKNHHSLTGTIKTTKGEVNVNASAGWHSKQVNSDEDHKVGMGVYAKASAWKADSKYGFSLITPPHDVVKRIAEHYEAGEAGALQDLLLTHPVFKTYVDKEKTPEQLADDLNTFREQSTRMQSAKALLLNRQSRSISLLAEHAWNEFKSAHQELSSTFDLPKGNFGATPPARKDDHQARVDLVTNANQQLGEAWTALSLGLAKARLAPQNPPDTTERLDKLAQEIKEVDIPSVHPLTAYGHSPIRLQSTDYKKFAKGFSAGLSFDLKLPSPIPTTDSDKTGPGALKGLLGTAPSVGGTIKVQEETNTGHPNPIRNGTFRTLAIDLKLQIPSLPGTPNPARMIDKIAETTALRVAQNIQEDPSLLGLNADERERMANLASRDVKAQLTKMLTHGQLPSNFTYTYETQWHKMEGAKEFSHAYGQHRLTVGTSHSMNLPISAYAGWGIDVQIGLSDSHSTTLASVPRLGGSVYGHLLSYHDLGELKPLVIRDGDHPRMNWDRLNHVGDQRLTDLAAQYFSNHGVLDFLVECSTLGEQEFQENGEMRNAAQVLAGQVAKAGKAAAWRAECGLTLEDTQNIEAVRQATQEMSAGERLDYFRQHDAALKLFDKYLAQIEFLKACNEHGKLRPGGTSWQLVAPVTTSATGINTGAPR